MNLKDLKIGDLLEGITIFKVADINLKENEIKLFWNAIDDLNYMCWFDFNDIKNCKKIYLH